MRLLLEKIGELPRGSGIMTPGSPSRSTETIRPSIMQAHCRWRLRAWTRSGSLAYGLTLKMSCGCNAR